MTMAYLHFCGRKNTRERSIMTKRGLTIVGIVSVLCLWSVYGQCPIDDAVYSKWSDSSTWTDQFPEGNIPEQASIEITKPVLLDVSSPPEVFSITIGAPNGILLFSDDIEISLRAHYIFIKDQGSLIIGSEECKHISKVLITLVGKQNDYFIQGFDEKFIGTARGGTIEIHGPYKLPWTKLIKTVHKVDKDHGIIYEHLADPGINNSTKGVVVHVFDKVTGLSDDFATIKIYGNKQSHTDAGVNELETFIAGIPDGKIVAIAIQKNIVKQDLTGFFDLIESLTGSDKIRSLLENGAYAAITVKGDTSQTVDELVQDPAEKKQTAVAVKAYLETGRKFKITSYVDGSNNARSFVNFVSSDTDWSMPILHLNNDATTWKAGDRVVLTSTDYKWKQAEECELIECDTCAANQVRVSCDPLYTHFAELCNGIDMLDMRGEVGLLTRNIKIMGETEPDVTFGGHIKMLQGFKNAHFEGIELTQMGQNAPGILGRYPIHFHMCEDVGPNTYEKPAYSRGNSIHHTFARGTTIHGTHGLHVHHNFIFDTLGHGIFFEDGGEQNNTIEWNLVGGQRKTDIIPSDDRPTSFWVTNPKNYFRNNIACGSDSVGFWFAYPDLPVAISRDRNFMELQEARHTAVYEFYNNVAHSNVKAGLFVDNKLADDHDLDGYNQYRPLVDPFNRSSPSKEVFLTKFTGFKNQVQNSWVRGGLITMDYCSLSDSGIGSTMVRDNDDGQVLTKCIIVGDSCNVGEFSVSNPRLGIVFGKGPTFVYDTYFDNFTKTDMYNAAAFSPDKMNTFRHTTPVHSVSGVLFGYHDRDDIGNRVWDEEQELSFDNDYVASFRAIDNSVTKKRKEQIVPIQDYLLTADCRIRESWGMAACPRYYGLLRVRRHPKDQDPEPDMVIARDDDPTLIDYSIQPNTTTKFMVMLGGKFGYIMAYKDEVPTSFYIEGIGVEKNQWVRVGICLPRKATFKLKANYMPVTLKELSDWKEVGSVEEVDNDKDGGSYLYDSSVGVLFVKVIAKRTRGEFDYADCPGAECPQIIISEITGDLTDSDCRNRAFKNDKYKRIVEVSPANPFPTKLGRSATSPPADWGAGMFPSLPGF